MILARDSDQLYNKFNSQNPLRDPRSSRNHLKKEKSRDEAEDESLYSNTSSNEHQRKIMLKR